MGEYNRLITCGINHITVKGYMVGGHVLVGGLGPLGSTPKSDTANKHCYTGADITEDNCNKKSSRVGFNVPPNTL